MVGFLLGYLNKNYKDITDINIEPKDFSEIIKMMSDGKFLINRLKDIFTKALDEDKNVLDVAKSIGTQISDKEEIRKIINEVFNENPKVIDDFKSGKKMLMVLLWVLS